MKKAIYCATPFVVVPVIFLLFTLLEGINSINSNILVIIAYGVFLLFSALMGSLSSTDKKFDYVMTAIIPTAMFITLFIGLFFDEGCDGSPQLSLNHALNMEYYYAWLPMAVIMTVTTFVASFKPIRIIRKR